MILPCLDPRNTQALASSIDIGPTLFDMLEMDKPYYSDGLSLLPNLKKNSGNVRKSCSIQYRNGYQDCASRALITDRYKLVRYQNGEAELTDLLKDPGEKYNVINDPEYTETLHNLNEMIMAEVLNSESKLHRQVCFA